MKPAFALLFAGAVLALPAAAQVKITAGAGKIPVEINGKPFTDFYVAGKAFDAEVTKPYLWPLRAASGTYITRAWPMEMVAEEAAEKKDHRTSAPVVRAWPASTSWISGTTKAPTKRPTGAR
jgi:hypothetical protein